MRRLPTAALGLLFAVPCVGAATTSAPEGQHSAARRLPLVPERLEEEDVLVLATDALALGELAHVERARFDGLPVPTDRGWETLDLELARMRLATADARYRVNGVVAGGSEALEAGLTLWRGTVVGADASEVYLAISTSGTRGWIARGADESWLLTGLREDGAHRGRTALRRARPTDWELGPAPLRCELLTRPDRELPVFERAVATATGDLGIDVACQSLRRCAVAVETDYDYYALFGDETAARQYALSLLGASSLRFEASAGTTLCVPELSIYTDPADPWTTPEGEDTDVVDLLFEFRALRSGAQFPAGAQLAHLLSGAALGGGVAWLDVLCDQGYGFGVSANLAGLTAFPVPAGDPFNWDFVVVTHELGHNFGTPHTHDFCPPIDECAPMDYFGPCQSVQSCATGTLMSYCHLCAGGITNIQTGFHPATSALMLQSVDASCLPLDCPASISGHLFADFDGDGAPGGRDFDLADAAVEVHGPGGTFTLRTDASGSFLLENLPCGSYTITTPPLRVAGGKTPAAPAALVSRSLVLQECDALGLALAVPVVTR